MTDYIPREAAIKAVNDLTYPSSLVDVKYKLVSIPAADVVEVVRCKDCKWYKTNYMWNCTEVKCCVIEPYEPVRKCDDFCSRGEKREDE